MDTLICNKCFTLLYRQSLLFLSLSLF
ncbi:hypothetical protein ALC57_08846 [Trachymyrmex cornetzi]|uniref:Uncharacterized protein n=1 Tax=Trachymyrmex cornetzi TaxID=471704 RepID=A0A151J704_9HYME|nr:hypothetical protein ALC57_08846 [Trachymyrmex cornetzi]